MKFGRMNAITDASDKSLYYLSHTIEIDVRFIEERSRWRWNQHELN